MNIISATLAAAFETNNEAALYHYQDVLRAALSSELRQDVGLALGMFGSALKHPEYAVKSKVAGDIFIAFQHENEVAVLVNKHGTVSLFMREMPVAELTTWLTAFVKQYLRKHNPDNLSFFPVMPAPVKATRAKKQKADTQAKAKKPKADTKAKAARPKVKPLSNQPALAAA